MMLLFRPFFTNLHEFEGLGTQTRFVKKVDHGPMFSFADLTSIHVYLTTWKVSEN